jgi:hypothetical protein
MSEQERAALDTVLEESPEGEMLEQEAQMNAMAQLQNGMAPQNQIMMPGEGAPLIAPGSEMSMAPAQTIGGMNIPNLANNVIPGQSGLDGEGLTRGAQVPGTGPVIAVRTDAEAMMADGIMPGGFGMGRQPRRGFRSFGGMGEMGGMGGMSPMMPSVSRYTPMEGGSGMPSSTPSGPITINKIE